MTELTPEALAILAGGDALPRKGSAVQTIAVVAGLTLIALAGGSGLGYLLAKPPAAAPQPAAVTEPAATATAETAIGAQSGAVLALEPVLTDIASPPGTQIRLEASLIIDPTKAEEPELLAAQVQADILVFVRTLELAQLEGARGLLHLREDLLERAKLRSPAVTDVVVRALALK